jgi:tetratricopeptide (TPR) repeat protein
MIPQLFSKENKTMTVDRQKMLHFLDAGLATGSYRFTRQAALSWLTSFPGDLEINLIYARALVKEKRFMHAAPVVQKVLRADPEYAEAAILAEEVFSNCDPAFLPLATGTIKTLGGTPVHVEKIPEWGFQLSKIRQAISHNQAEDAENQLLEIINESERVELVSYYHLVITERLNDKDTLITLARLYQSRWPECIQIALVLAKALMDSGDTDEAVKILHFCAASDPVGQVPARLWGKNFAYLPLYPREMKIDFEIPIPA